VIASNTSSLRIEDLRTALQRPERLVGIHFFNPVAMMPLVEVIEAPGVDGSVLQQAMRFVRIIDKLPLPVKSAPGFLVNAVLAPYMLAAMRKVDSKVSAHSIDQAMLDFGMPMGPLMLADTVGLDIVMAAGRSLTPDASTDAVPQCLQDRVSAGHLGKKNRSRFLYLETRQSHRAGHAAPNAAWFDLESSQSVGARARGTLGGAHPAAG
jgi:3-hydroxyacyl-CoA dehydrogenase/enoyl-CoA hydratase/3-hydroxybutyryl-CoA epimerase